MAKRYNVSETVLAARREMKNEKDLSPSLKTTMEGILDLVVTLANRLGLDSSNSSKPPSSDPNRIRKIRMTKGRRRKPGGQTGHSGSRLEQIENPTKVEELSIDRRTLPPGKWKSAGFDKRQVFDVDVSFSVTEYRAEVLENELGETYVAEFPDGVTELAQYGLGVKSTSVYLSQFQLIPQARVQDLLKTQYGLPLAKGSVNNFNTSLCTCLAFECQVKYMSYGVP